MLHPDTELKFIDSSIGFGVFAVQPISRGTLIWVRDELDAEIDASRDHTLSPQMLEHYAYRLQGGNYLLCWDFTRYMNHSCEPNCINPGLDFELAVRDIAAGEQLTNDYVMLNIEASMRCACGATSCRGVVDPDDFPYLHTQWDRWVLEAFADIGHVAQPLWPLTSGRDRRAIRRGIRSASKIPSTRFNCDGSHRPAVPTARVATR